MHAPSPHAFMLDRLDTPLGMMLLVTDDRGHLRAADFHDYEERMHRLLRRQYASQGGHLLRDGRAPDAIHNGLDAYFAGDLSAIDRIEVMTGGTAFQRNVWQALRTVAAGGTVSYGGLAARIGAADAVRAVGAANGANPIAIVVPCHRLIGANGDLTGYGGGLARKRWLLMHEGAELRTPA